MNFKDKVVLITGAGGGIGKATALLFAEHGAKVVANGKQKGAETADLINSKGGESIFVPGDVSDAKSAEEVVKKTIEAFGRLDVLVNNAGIVLPGNLENTTLEAFDLTMQVNVKGVFLMSKYAVAEMKKTGGGVIVNIGSVAALKGHVDRVAYCASKGAVVAMSRAIAAEYIKDNIRCNVICPGTTYTPAIEEKIRTAADPKAMEATFVGRQPMGRLGKVEEIAQAVAFAACEEASYMTGSVLVIDGGMTM